MPPETNPVNRNKLPGSKWTATRPRNKEKHFIVLGWQLDADGHPTERIEIEAVYTKAVRHVHWRDLKDRSSWLIGWV